MDLVTAVSRDRWNNLSATTCIPLGFDNRELRIQTRKHSIHGGIYCNAFVVTITPMGYSHAIGLGAGGDFSKTLDQDRSARATEKAIRAMHQRCLVAGAYAVLDEAIRHYPQPIAA